MKYIPLLNKNFYFNTLKKFSPNNNNTCILSVVNFDFIKYFEVFCKSLLYHNKSINFDWIIYYHDEYSKLSSEHIMLMKTYYRNLIFKKINIENYENLIPLTPEHLVPALFKIEAFNLTKYEKVVCFDIDMLCTGNLEYLFKYNFGMALSLAGKNYDDKIKYSNRFKRFMSFNNGVVVLDKEFIKNDIYKNILSFNSACPLADQTLFDNYFRFVPKFVLPFEYNFNINFFYEKKNFHKIKIIHYAGDKPLNNIKNKKMIEWFNFCNQNNISV